MKKRLFLTFVMVFIFALTLAFAVSAGTVHNENTVDYSATVTLDDGTKLELFDNEGNALIWYISGTQDGKNSYSSVRADDDEKVKWTAESWDEVQSWGITGVDTKKVVVINLMDDDVVRNTGNAAFLNKPMDKFKLLFSGMKNFTSSLLRKSGEVTLDPMKYVDKKVVAYKNPGKNFSSPYTSSIYSGMMFNSYC